MKKSTKTALFATLWSLSSGVGVLYFADMADKGHHAKLAEAGMAINGGQLAVACFILMFLGLSELD